MSILSEIKRIDSNVAATYEVLESAGVPVSTTDNSDQLPAKTLQLAALKQNAVTSVAVNLASNGWSNLQQTIPVPGVSAAITNQIIFVAPTADSAAEFRRTGVQCDAQSENALTFSAGLAPEQNLTVLITIMEVMTT